MRVRLITAVFVAPVALAACVAISKPAKVVAANGGPSCGEKIVRQRDVAIKILFAKNGAVQRYLVLTGADVDMEGVNDLRLALQKQYGPADIDAPPLKIISFKPAPGGSGMSIPDKAIDSCGRTLSFQ